MADSVVSFLLEHLTPLLIQELKLQRGVKDQVRSLEKELSLINAFLKDNEGKRHDNELVKEVVSQIRDAAYEAEDVIDTFIMAVTKHRRKSMLGKLIHSCDRAISFHEVANKIESIKIINKKIDDNRSKYGIEIAGSSGGDAGAEDILHRRRKHVEEDHVVGFSQDTEALVKQLIQGNLQRNVVSVIGMGGLGKTTLARKIYNNNDVKNYFDFRGWVYVSQEYRISELLLEILKGLTPLLPRVMLRAELKEKFLHGLESLYAKYSSNNDKLKGKLTEDLKRFKEMDDEEFGRAWSKFLEGIKEKDHTHCKKDHCEKDHTHRKKHRTDCKHPTDCKKDQADCRKHHTDLKNSLSNFVQEFYSENGLKLQDMTNEELKSVLHECLEDKRYLLVMDDIWKIDVWNEVSTVFPNNSNGSRILITSRIKEVALHATTVNNSVPPIPPYELPFLDKEKGWELFSKKVFWEGTCPPELETLGRQLVESCQGLPLAIVVLGGLLACKEKTPRIWSKYIGHVNSYLSEDRSSCIDILALSYNQLPRHLKPCFLYLGIYPEDFEIPVGQQIRLWIAEGFIGQIGNRNMEDVAEDYLEELINRSLIQVATKRLDGGVKTCRIHDLLRDLCISESAEEKFLEVRSDVIHPPMSKCRRISFHFANRPYISSNPCKSSNNRSVIGFGGVVGLKSPLDKGYNLKRLCESNKLVRVIELSNMAICCLIPKKIEKLVLLRYLSISSGVLHAIPDSICNLWNLETLDMRNSQIKCLSKGIWKLEKLRHLYFDGPTSLPRTDNEAGLPNLQVLTGIALNHDTQSLFAKARFPNLRKLGLCLPNALELLHLDLSNFDTLRHLQTLKICEYVRLSNPRSLQWTLTKITLRNVPGYSASASNCRVLSKLANLRILKVVDSRNFDLDCKESSFCQLEVLKMARVTDIQWTMEKGALPMLQRLVIHRCDFHTIPLDELRCLTALRDVEILHLNPELAKELQQLQRSSKSIQL